METLRKLYTVLYYGVGLIEPQFFLECNGTSYKESLAEALEILEVEICSSLKPPKLTTIVQCCSNEVTVLTSEDVDVHLHAVQAATAQFQLCEGGQALSSWRSASLLGNNVWIMGCAWLSNLSTYFLAVIVTALMGLAEHCDIAPQTFTEPYFNVTVGTRHSEFYVFLGDLQTRNFGNRGRTATHVTMSLGSSYLMCRLYGRDTGVYTSGPNYQS
jgi:hypothetical protein